MRMPCSHSICLECLLSLALISRQIQTDNNDYFSKDNFINKLECPVCFQSFQLPVAELELKSF